MELQDHLRVLVLIFLRNSILFSVVAASVSIPTSRAQGFPFSTSLPPLISFLLIIAILTGLKWCLTLVLIYISLKISDTEYIFIFLDFRLTVGHLCVLFEKKKSIRIPCPYFNWILCFFVIELCEFTVYFRYWLLIGHMVGRYFLPFGASLFHFDDFLFCAEAFWFQQSHWFAFAFVAFTFSVKSKKSSPRPTSRSYCLCFLLGVLWF